MSLDIQKDVLFVGHGASTICYYRVLLPAMALGCDWVGATGEPPSLQFPTGLIDEGQPDAQHPDLAEWPVVILQQPSRQGWFGEIDRLKKKGVTVLYEIDDYIQGVPKMPDHDHADKFPKERIARAEALMRMCDGIICSTEFIAKRYRKFNRNIYVCQNGIDPKRYALTKPKRETVNIGWAGATGHQRALIAWLEHILGLMMVEEQTTFVSVGAGFAEIVRRTLGPERGISIPFVAIEQYPGAMTMFDIAIAPAGKGSFFRGKSDLRWLEASALGIPTVADPMVYGQVEDGVTGLLASDGAEATKAIARLVKNPGLREEIGRKAKEKVLSERSFPRAAQAWADALEALT